MRSNIIPLSILILPFSFCIDRFYSLKICLLNRRKFSYLKFTIFSLCFCHGLLMTNVPGTIQQRFTRRSEYLVKLFDIVVHIHWTVFHSLNFCEIKVT